MSRLKPFLVQPSRELAQSTSGKKTGLFHSARLKLTAFYLAIVIFFSLSLTLTVRGLAERAMTIEGGRERGAVHSLLFNYYSVPPQPDSVFNHFQYNQEEKIRSRLDLDVLLINLIALVGGGMLSYWFAGRTLRPIEEAHETQARFAADASHELRTPLASLKLENEVFLRQKKFSEGAARQLIQSNLEEVDRLEHLASNLLSLTQIGQSSLRSSRVKVSEIVESAIHSVDKTANQKQIVFKVNVRDREIYGNKESLVQVCVLILDNAIKYSPSGSSLFVDGVIGNNRYNLSIRDEGNGIDETDLPHIFERLYRGDKSRSTGIPGYGLGLSLAQALSKANNGTITARNYPSGGAQFVLSLNLVKD